MKTKLHIKLLMLVLLVSGIARAQFIEYERDTKWNIGFNMGGVWQDADIDLDRPGFGYGFTLGRSIFESPGRVFGLDLRFRYLRGHTYGLDPERIFVDSTTYDGYYADAMHNYVDSGYTYLNNKTDIHDYSLEAVLKFHKLRESTGILFHVFGGVGITDYQTKFNLTDDLSNTYDYSSLPETDIMASMAHENLLDDSYETNAPTQSERQIKFMPSVGVGIGYQITPSFSIGVEHRTTFTLYDDFDGHRAPGSEFLNLESGNDIYHYSVLNLRWNIFRGKVDDTYTPPPTDNTSNLAPCDKPYVNFITPAVNQKFETPYISVSAKVSRINNNNDVVVKVNGIATATEYNPSTELMTANATLIKGSNTIEIIASNKCGNTVLKRIVTLEEKACPKPSVVINAPVGGTVNTATHSLNATVANLDGGSIDVTVNGKKVYHTYNSSTQQLGATLNLVKGNNTIMVKAANTCGDTVVYLNLDYQDVPCLAPTATILSPVNGSVSNASTITFSARVTQVTANNQISIKHNGQLKAFSFNAANGTVSAQINLALGNNGIQIIVTNDCGSDTKEVYVTHEKAPCKLPVVSLSSPLNGQKVSSPSINLNGSALNLANASQVAVYLNGTQVVSSFNPANGLISASLKLKLGSNTILVKATNECGTDEKSVTITYEKLPCLTPVITYVSPQNGQVFTVNSVNVTASVLNITSNSQIVASVNGTAVSTSFNNVNKTVAFAASLKKGTNTISIKATNNCGTVSQDIVITYECPQPVVNIVSPANGIVLNTSSVSLSAIIDNVSSNNELQVKVNGGQKAFSYNVSTKTLTANLTLKSGQNTIEVIANTACGTESKVITVTYEKPCNKPVLSIVSPASGQNFSSATITLSGTVTNLTSQNQLTVTLNGNSVVTNLSGNSFNIPLTLVKGTNTISVKAQNSCGDDTRLIEVTYDAPCPKPVVNILAPVNGQLVKTKTIGFTASVSNITSSSQVIVSLNGTIISGTYNGSSKQVTATLNLIEGNNTVKVIAQNECGKDEKSINVTFKCDKPQINFVNQNSISGVVASASASIVAKVTNVANSNQIVVKLNGVAISHNYNASTELLNINTTLKSGKNVISIVASNDCGSDQQELVIEYTPPCDKPVVSITSPQDGITVNTSSLSITGVALNTNSQSEVVVKVNGQVKSFSYNASTKAYNLNATLNEGVNTIIVEATTNCGNDSKTVKVTYKKPCVNPTARILSPTATQSFPKSTTNLTIQTSGVANKSDIVLKLNGTVITNFNFNQNSGLVSGTLSIRDGLNTLSISVSNACGTASDNLEFTKAVACPVPSVTISSPSNNATVNTNTVSVSGIALNTGSQTEIEVKVNGTAVPFNYNNGTKAISFTATLNEGVNTIFVEAATNCGNDSKTVKVTYKKPCVNPTARILSPTATQSFPKSTTNLTIQTSGVTNKSDIVLKLNGTVITNFNFNQNSGLVSGTLTIRDGLNTLSISVSNACGTASDNLEFTKAVACPVPSVTISSPSNNATVNTNTVSVSGIALNTGSQTEIEVKVNGTAVPFNYNNGTKAISFTATLNEGVNTIFVEAATNCGNDSKTVTVTYKKPCDQPIVTIGSPTNGSTVTTGTVLVNGVARNTASQSEVVIKVNGVNQTYNYNFKSKIYDFTASLKEGNNVITVTATTGCGTVTKTVTVNYKKPCDAPKVIVTSPKKGAEVNTNSVTVSAKASNAKSSSQVKVKLNGKVISHNFNSGTEIVTANVSGLKAGKNSIVIEVDNGCGKVSETISVTYKVIKPIINVSVPSSSSSKVTTPNARINALVDKIQSDKQVTVKLNGKSYTSIAVTKKSTDRYELNAEMVLVEGKNTIVIEAKNNYGQMESKTITIVYEVTTKDAPKKIDINGGSIKPGGSTPRR